MVVFDWDQTLWDSWELHLRSLQYASQQMGLPAPSAQEVVAVYQGTLEDHLKRLYGMQAQRAEGQYLEFYRDHWRSLGRLFPGVRRLVERLAGEGYALALLSNKVRWAGEQELEEAGLRGIIQVSLFKEDVQEAKPAPEGLRRIVETLGITPQQAVFAGDTAGDVQCARRAGAVSAAALWGSLDTAALLASFPDLAWRRPEEALMVGRQPLAPGKGGGGNSP